MRARRKAMTLIELMVALTIAALVTAAALTASVSLTRVDADQQRSGSDPMAALIRLIESDLSHAMEYRRSPAGLELRTGQTLTGEALQQVHLPSTVEYVVRRIGERNCLVRIQRPQVRGDNPTIELVCWGVRRLFVVPLDKRTAEATAADTADSGKSDGRDESAEAGKSAGRDKPGEPQAWKAAPAGMTVTVEFDEPVSRIEWRKLWRH